MAKSEGQKLRILYLLKMLLEESDETHPLSTKDIIEKMEHLNIKCERKTIYDDVRSLTEFGYDIELNPSRLGGGYYVASREFELPELKLLVDAVVSSRFVTQKKSNELIQKLENKASKYERSKLQRQVYVAQRVKTDNEKIYYNVDCIHNAIQDNRQISFQYMDWNIKKELVARSSERKIVSPWALIWKEENYYLAAYEQKSGIMKHYRVDKMNAVELETEKRQGLADFERIDLAEYANETFGMYAGKDEVVVLEMPTRFAGIIIDRFGKEVSLRSVSSDLLRARIKVKVSGPFFGWVAGLGEEIRIVGPSSVAEEYKEWLQKILTKIQ